MPENMKKLIILMLALIPFISNCKKDKEPDLNLQIREIAWNSLSDQEKTTVTIDWKQSPVTESTYSGKSAYAVRFNTSDEALLGPITVYVDTSSHVVLGQDLRD
jgi:hypothetical protein